LLVPLIVSQEGGPTFFFTPFLLLYNQPPFFSSIRSLYPCHPHSYHKLSSLSPPCQAPVLQVVESRPPFFIAAPGTYPATKALFSGSKFSLSTFSLPGFSDAFLSLPGRVPFIPNALFSRTIWCWVSTCPSLSSVASPYSCAVNWQF